MSDEPESIVLKVAHSWRPTLSLVPCNHFWLEVKTSNQVVTAICKHRGCKRREYFSMEQWGALAQEGRCLNKPVRV